MECIERIAQPTSTVRMPSLDSIGPTVEPHDLRIKFRPHAPHIYVLDYAHIISNFVFLHVTTFLLYQVLDDEAAYRIAGIALAGICLDDDTAVHPRRMVLFMFRAVIGMYRMRNIAADQK